MLFKKVTLLKTEKVAAIKGNVEKVANLFKVNNRNTRIRCEICSKLAIKTPERRQ